MRLNFERLFATRRFGRDYDFPPSTFGARGEGLVFDAGSLSPSGVPVNPRTRYFFTRFVGLLPYSFTSFASLFPTACLISSGGLE